MRQYKYENKNMIAVHKNEKWLNEAPPCECCCLGYLRPSVIEACHKLCGVSDGNTLSSLHNSVCGDKGYLLSRGKEN